MNLKKTLTPERVILGLPGKTKDDIIKNLVKLLCDTGDIKDRKGVLKAVKEREEQMSTGMKHGIGIPHGKTDAVDQLHACVVISKHPVDFDSLDGEPCRIFLMTLSPKAHTGPHLQFLAEVSGLLKKKEKRDQILQAKTKEELLRILLDEN